MNDFEISSTREKIMKSAKAEFLAHGFSGASLRTIASGAGVTTGALYKYFRDKAELFDALVAPTVQRFIEMYHQSEEAFMKSIDIDGLNWTSSDGNLTIGVNYIYDNLEVFQLLLLSAEKTAYENFTHIMIDKEVEATLRYVEIAKSRGHLVNTIDREDLHLLVSAQFSALFEMVLHDLPRERAMQATQSIYRFFKAGWRAFLFDE